MVTDAQAYRRGESALIAYNLASSNLFIRSRRWPGLPGRSVRERRVVGLSLSVTVLVMIAVSLLPLVFMVR